MNKSIFTLMTAALLMAGPVINVAHAAAGDKVPVAATTTSALEGSKFYLGDKTGGKGLFKGTGVKIENVDYMTLDEKDDVGAGSNVVADAGIFEARNIESAGAKAVSFELWVNGKQVVVKAEDGKKAESTDKLAALSTRFVATYADAKDVSTLGFTNLYTASLPTQEIADATAYLATVEQDAAFLQDYNAKGLTFSFEGKNVIGNAFEETLQVVPVVAKALNGSNPTTGGFVLAKGTADDMKAFIAAAKQTDGSIIAAAKKVSLLSITDETYKINGAQDKEAAVIKVLEKGKYVPDATTQMPEVLFTKVEQADFLNNPAALTLTMGDVIVGGVQPDGKGDNVYVTTVLDGVSSTLIANPAILGTSTYLDASVLLKKDAVNTVNIYFTSGKQSIDGDANQQYEYHKYLVAGVDADAYQLEARAKAEIDLASPITQWVVSKFDGKYTFTLTNREAHTTGAKLELSLKATDVDGEYEIIGGKLDGSTLSTGGAGEEIKGGVTASSKIEGNAELVGKVVRFNSVATTKTDGFLSMTKAEREGGFHLLFSGKIPGGVAEMYGVLANNNTADADYTPEEAKGDYAFTAEVVKGGSPEVANYIINAVDAAYLDKDGNTVTIKDTLAVPSYKLYVGKTSAGSDKLYLAKTAAKAVTADEGEFFFRKNNDGTYAMGLINSNYAGSVAATANAFNVKADGSTFEKIATLYNSEAISNVTFEFNDNSDATSLPAEPRHATFNNTLGSVAMQMNKNGLQEGILSKEGLTFWLDTVGKADVAKFYISRGVEGQTERLFMFNSSDSLGIFSEDEAQLSENKNYLLEGTEGDPKAIFRSATLIAKDTLGTVIDGEATKLVKDDLKAYQYTIQLNDEAVDNEYVVKSVKGGWLYALNGKLGFTSARPQAMVFTLAADAPTANDATPSVSEVKVIALDGAIRISGAQGKKVVVSNILGQVIANTAITSDDATIAAPAGLVVVAVEGEEAVKAIVL